MDKMTYWLGNIANMAGKIDRLAGKIGKGRPRPRSRWAEESICPTCTYLSGLS